MVRISDLKAEARRQCQEPHVQAKLSTGIPLQGGISVRSRWETGRWHQRLDELMEEQRTAVACIAIVVPADRYEIDKRHLAAPQH